MNGNRQDLGGPSGGKSWERAWTTDEIRQSAHAWNLAGDSGLLKHLQEFSQNIIARTHATEKALDSLVEEINTLSAEANTINNKFLCLANTQFVENRVYDDDDKETPQDELVNDKKSKEETEAKMLQNVREALSMSVAVLDTMFEPVEIQASDSDGESDSDKIGAKTLILEPHNPYIHRPLPHLIGSEAFMSDDRIGLGDSPSDGEEQMSKETDDEMDASSESDVDFTLFGASKRSREVYSSHSSVSDFASHEEASRKHSKRNKPVDHTQDSVGYGEDILQDSTCPENEQVPKTDSFASQLAAKLGKIASPPSSNNLPAENKMDHTEATSDNLFGRADSEDEDDELFGGSSSLFSGRPKLFDDLEDTNNSLWGPEPGEKRENLTTGAEKTEQPVTRNTQIPTTGDNIFSNSISDEEEGLFSIKSSKLPKPVSAATESQLESRSSGISKPLLLEVDNFKHGISTSTSAKPPDVVQVPSTFANGRKPELFKHSVPSSSELARAPVETEPTPNNNNQQAGNLPSQDKKPTGGVPMFGQANILAGLKAKLPRRPSSSSSESSEVTENNSKTSPPSQPAPSPVNRPTNEDQGQIGAFQNNVNMGFSSRPPASIKLSNDDGHEAIKVSSSILSVPPIETNSRNFSDNDDLFSTKPPYFTSQSSKTISGGLFAEENDNEDDLFAVTPGLKKTGIKSSLDSSGKTNSSAVPPKEDAILSTATPSGKSGNLSQQSPSNTPSVNTFKGSGQKSFPQIEFDRNDIYSSVPPPLRVESKVKKPLSLFDDSDSGEDELLFSSASSAGSRRSQASTDILAASAVSTIEKTPLGKKGLFDDDDALFGSSRNDPDIDIFSGTSEASAQPIAPPETSQPTSHSSVAEGVLGKNELTSNRNISKITETENVKSMKSSMPEPVKSIFKDDLFADDEDNDDLFCSKPNLFIPTGKNDDVEDDLFADISGSSTKPKEQDEANQLENAQDPKLLKDIRFEESAHNTATLKAVKPTLVVMNIPEQDQNMVAAVVDKVTSSHDGSSNAMIKKEKLVPKTEVLEHRRKPEPPRTLDIRKETEPGLGLLDDSDDDDLFGSSPSKATPKLSSPSKQVSHPDSSSSKFISKLCPFPKQDSKPTLAVKPETTAKPLLETAAENLPSIDCKEDTDNKKLEKSEVDGSSVRVSKLRDSLFGGSGLAALKLDPSVLLPGQKPPPRRTPPKEDTHVRSAVEPENRPSSEANSIGFDQPAMNKAVLPSSNKDRAKLGVKRRPPSNRARREAARASLQQSDQESPLSPDGSSAVIDPISAVNTSQTSSNSIVSPSTDEDDLFGVPQDLPPEYGNPNVPTSDIFSGAPILSPISDADPSKQLKQGEAADSSAKLENQKNITHENNKPPLFVPSEESDRSSDDLLFARKVEPAILSPSDQLFEQGLNVTLESPSVELFSPKPSGSSEASVVSTSDDGIRQPMKQGKSSEPPEIEAAENKEPVNSNTDNIAHIRTSTGENVNDDSTLTSLLSNNKPITAVGGNSDNVLKTPSPPSDLHFSSVAKDESALSMLDPLNKSGDLSVNEDELFGKDGSRSETDDRSSLFPFVKKPENKPASSQPLFSQTPALPSKADKPSPKSSLGALDDVEGDGLFSSTSKTLHSNKSQDVSNILKSKPAKAWDFSDEDDDDLFLPGMKSASSNPSSKTKSSVSSLVSSSNASVESKTTAKPLKPPSPKDTKKMTQVQTSSKNGLFSEENDDDLFSKPSPFSKVKTKEGLASKSSLFDDDDDDLFGSKLGLTSGETLGQNKSKKLTGVNKQLSSVSNLKKENVFDDPLLALQNDP